MAIQPNSELHGEKSDIRVLKFVECAKFSLSLRYVWHGCHSNRYSFSHSYEKRRSFMYACTVIYNNILWHNRWQLSVCEIVFKLYSTT